MVSAEQIKRARNEVLKESQEAFARRFGVVQTTIHRWETDGPPTRGPGRMAIERVLNEIQPEAAQ
jgi:DNA-binding transcriptional regulator YiaG